MTGAPRLSAEPEDLPPLELRKLRDLDLQAGPEHSSGRPHLAAASGVVRRGDFVYVIGDDQLAIGEFLLTTAQPGRLRRVLAEAHASGDKPDLEALTALPPFEGCPYGGLLGFGSGSKPSRDRGFWWPLASDGSLRDDPRELDLKPAYNRLREQLPALNIEGAAAMGERLWLFHRGGADRGSSAIAELHLGQVLHSLREDLQVDCDEVLALRAYDLGELDGVALAFSDATPVAEQVIVFTASAEEPESGKIRGSVVGTIDPQGEIRRLRTIDRRWKVEGVYAAIDTGVVDLTFVCDQDDETVPSPLLSATMPIDGRLESSVES